MKEHLQPDFITLSFISYACIPFQAELQADQLDVQWGDGTSIHYESPGIYRLCYTYATEGLQRILLSGKNISFLRILGEPVTTIRLHHCPHLRSLEGLSEERVSIDAGVSLPPTS